MLAVINQNVMAQNNMDSNLNLLLNMASMCQNTLEKSSKSNSNEVYEELNAVLDTLDKNNVKGILPSCILSDMIKNSFSRKDTLAAFTHMVDLRNRAYNALYHDITDPFNYGLGHLYPGSNQWIGESVVPMIFYRHHVLNLLLIHPDTTIAQYAYEALFHTKGMKLMANNNFKFLADESGNEQIRRYFKELLKLQSKYRELDAEYKSNWHKYKDEFNYKILDYPKRKTLKESIVGIKDSIFTIANSDNTYIQKFFTPWFTIQNQLSDSEIAIEFASVATHTGKNQYIALIIDNLHKFPVFIELCYEDELKQIDATYSEGLKKMYDLIWRPIETYIENKRKIYFSADGLLHILPIEYATPKRVFRLSSTREIIKNNPKKKRMNVVAYGGLNYETYDTLSRSKKELLQGSSSSIVTRGTRGALPWTLVEVEKLEKLVNAIVYKGEKGSEESFYQLENSDFNVLHMATHGFYYTPDEVEEKRNFISNYSFIDLSQDHFDRELTHSGLILSGANNTLRGEPIPDGLEDGILTAKEITNTNLNQFDMVVLSTCQSGLGNITNEGVYGLQRGFKMAGVNTILMSLWEVDDKATQLLMVEFYKQILLGHPKQFALKIAQEYVQQQNQEYQSPYYWAGFILVDALD